MERNSNRHTYCRNSTCMGTKSPAIFGNPRVLLTARTVKGQCGRRFRWLPQVLKNSSPITMQATDMSSVATEKWPSKQTAGLQANHVVPSTIHVEWFNKNKHLWTEVSSKDELLDAVEMQNGKFTVIDFYAGWCSSCKAAYPALCKIAGNRDYTKDFHFVKANVQKRDIAAYIRSLGVKGIPTIVVFSPSGEKLAQFGASFKKMSMVKANLLVMSANSGSEFVTDANGFVFPRPLSV